MSSVSTTCLIYSLKTNVCNNILLQTGSASRTTLSAEQHAEISKCRAEGEHNMLNIVSGFTLDVWYILYSPYELRRAALEYYYQLIQVGNRVLLMKSKHS